MKKRTLMMLVIGGALLLLPLQALAQVCFRPSPFSTVVKIGISSGSGEFFDLVGEEVGSCGAGTSGPFSGTAHLRSDGKAHVGLGNHIVSGTTCGPYWYTLFLNPPTFDTGTGFHRNIFGITTTLTVTAASCQPLPQQLESGPYPGTP